MKAAVEAGAPGSRLRAPGWVGDSGAGALENDVPAALARAAAWMSSFPEAELRFDAAIGLTRIRARWNDPRLDAVLARARTLAERDGDNPLQRFWRPGFNVPAEASSRWEVPAAGAPRANVNRVLSEALHCARNGLRPGVLAYVAGPMRDGGGYQTAHGLWALTVAREQGCLDGEELARRAAPLADELGAAQPERPGPSDAEIDLFAERALMLELAGRRDAQVGRWLEALLAAQQPDGAFGAAAPGEPAYLRFHATLAASWALAESLPR